MTVVEQLFKALEKLIEYREHLLHCESAMTETCTCGMREAAMEARKALCAYRVRNGQ